MLHRISRVGRLRRRRSLLRARQNEMRECFCHLPDTVLAGCWRKTDIGADKAQCSLCVGRQRHPVPSSNARPLGRRREDLRAKAGSLAHCYARASCAARATIQVHARAQVLCLVEMLTLDNTVRAHRAHSCSSLRCGMEETRNPSLTLADP